MVLVMTVEPGYGGQALIPETLDKVRTLRNEITARGLDIDIQVDGGINEKNAKDAIAAGANVLVAGSAVYRGNDRKAAIDALR
jgi:ribulose-phosphate 3-epimerase